MRLKEQAESRVRYGYRRLHVLLQREGWYVNRKRLYRLWLVNPHALLEAAVCLPVWPRPILGGRHERCLGGGLHVVPTV